MAQQPQPEAIQVPTTWIGVESVPIQFANSFLGQVDDQADVILSIGQANPPVLIGTPEQVAQQAQRIAYIPVTPICRLSLSRTRMGELVTVLQQTLEIQEKNIATLRRLRGEQK